MSHEKPLIAERLVLSSFLDCELRKRYRLLVFIFGLTFLLVLEGSIRPEAIKGMYFQAWSSEDMMQTISIIDLRYAAGESLFYLHIQPPALDGIRALLVLLWPYTDRYSLLKNVDNGLYILWAIAYALLGTVMYLWLEQLTNATFALLGSALFFLHPATIFYASFLDATFLSAFCILWSYYELWKVMRFDGHIGRLVTAIVGLFFVRSLFQWYTVLIYALSLWMAKIPPRKIVLFTVSIGVVTGMYTLKQYYLFGVPSSSSFFGSSCFHALGEWPDTATHVQTSVKSNGAVFSLSPPLPQVLTRQTKLTGTSNYNELSHLRGEQALANQCFAKWMKQPLYETVISIMQNIDDYFMPSSRYRSLGIATSITQNIMVERLPWRDIYDTLFSGVPLFFVLVFSVAFWLANHSQQETPFAFGLLLPALYIFLVSVAFEKGETMRYKFFLEPILYIFTLFQIYSFSVILRRRFTKNKP